MAKGRVYSIKIVREPAKTMDELGSNLADRLSVLIGKELTQELRDRLFSIVEDEINRSKLFPNGLLCTVAEIVDLMLLGGEAGFEMVGGSIMFRHRSADGIVKDIWMTQ